MSFFYQKIAYIGLYDESQKIKNIGFTKIRADDTNCKVEIQINGLLPTDTFVCNVYCRETDRKLDELSINEGRVFYSYTFAKQGIGKDKIHFDEFNGIEIRFPGRKKGIATWEKAKEIQAAETHDKVYVAERKLKSNCNMVQDKKNEVINRTNRDEISKIIVEEIGKTKIDELNNKNMDEAIKIRIEETPEKKWRIEKSEKISWNSPNKNTILPSHPYQNKWEQMSQLFPSIKPFKNQQEGEYLSIAPKDFVILNEAHQALVNNSFLLHGYYNYRHLLLGKRVEREKELYYIGVPGNFYKREKMVAVMFGFEAFEPASQEEEELTQGTFGYYLKEVTI